LHKIVDVRKIIRDVLGGLVGAVTVRPLSFLGALLESLFKNISIKYNNKVQITFIILTVIFLVSNLFKFKSTSFL
jgi:hypothetical protein